MIYTFYKNDNSDKKIIVWAGSYLEAVNAVVELYGTSSNYNFKEYKIDNINPIKYLKLENSLYSLVPYILTPHQYDELTKDNSGNFIKNEFDHSGDFQYNCAIPLRNVENIQENCINRINEKNNISPEELQKKFDNEDYQLLENINNNLSKILYNYVNSINNQQTRLTIKNDITELIKKYTDTYLPVTHLL